MGIYPIMNSARARESVCYQNTLEGGITIRDTSPLRNENEGYSPSLSELATQVSRAGDSEKVHATIDRCDFDPRRVLSNEIRVALEKAGITMDDVDVAIQIPNKSSANNKHINVVIAKKAKRESIKKCGVGTIICRSRDADPENFLIDSSYSPRNALVRSAAMNHSRHGRGGTHFELEQEYRKANKALRVKTGRRQKGFTTEAKARGMRHRMFLNGTLGTLSLKEA